MTPFYINECLCWLHRGTSKRGVVLCSPIGLEDLVMHRFIRRLACDIARAGMPALRFDYRGTGDSAGTDSDPDTVQRWLSNVRATVEWLRHRAGVEEVVLVGFRVGSLLAAHAAAQLGDIAALALVGPVASGRAYMREALALRSFVAQNTEGAPPEDDSRSGLSVAGFHLSSTTVRDLERLDMETLARRPAPRVLLLGRSGSPAEQRLADSLRALGSDVSVGILPGFASMPWNSSLAVLPTDAFDELRQWICRDMPRGRAACMPFISGALTSSEWREEPLQFGRDGRLFGVHCTPRASLARSAVLIVNHGLNRHIGWGRSYVSLARRLASQGIASLRMDIAGVGDSETAAGRPEHVLYAAESIADVEAAVDWLRQHGYEAITLLGHSSGAHLGFHSAIADPRITGLAMINLPKFHCDPMAPSDYARRQVFRSTSWYWSQITRLGVWRRLLAGQVHVARITRMIAARLLRRASVRISSILERTTLATVSHTRVFSAFRRIAERGTKIMLIYSKGDEGLDELALYCGRGGRALHKLNNVELHIIDDADHNLTARSSQELYFNLLERHIGVARISSRATPLTASAY